MEVHPLFSPVTAILAGVIILLCPRFLNYVVAFYLILTGFLAITGSTPA